MKGICFKKIKKDFAIEVKIQVVLHIQPTDPFYRSQLRAGKYLFITLILETGNKVYWRLPIKKKAKAKYYS